MKIINACERFAWQPRYWVNNGYGEIKSKSKSSPSVCFSSKENAKNKAVKVVDHFIDKLITQK